MSGKYIYIYYGNGKDIYILSFDSGDEIDSSRSSFHALMCAYTEIGYQEA